MNDIEHRLYSELIKMKDEKYKQFNCKLIPNVDPEKCIGIRTPQLRKFAKLYSKDPDCEKFIHILPHEYYEENNLHAMIISLEKDVEKTYEMLDEFLPYVDNWGTCDIISPVCFKKHPGDLIDKTRQWLTSSHTYTIRFAIGVLMSYYFDEKFDDAYLKLVADVKSDEYYVNMMIAWYFATALAKQYDSALPYIENNCLTKWTHNKAIQKALESYRVSQQHKDYLRKLKVKVRT